MSLPRYFWCLQLDTESESTLATVDIYEREAQLIIDYSGLTAELGVGQQLPSSLPRWSLRSCLFILYCEFLWTQTLQEEEVEEEVEAYIQRLTENLSSIEGVLHRTTAPNLKAVEKMKEVKDKLQGVTEGLLPFNVEILNISVISVGFRVGFYIFLVSCCLPFGISSCGWWLNSISSCLLSFWRQHQSSQEVQSGVWASQIAALSPVCSVLWTRVHRDWSDL